MLGFRPSCNGILSDLLAFCPSLARARSGATARRTRHTRRAPRARVRACSRARTVRLLTAVHTRCLVAAPNSVSSMHTRHTARGCSAEPRFCLLLLPEDLLRVVLQRVPTEDWLTVALAYKPARDICKLLASVGRRESDDRPLFLTRAVPTISRAAWAIDACGATPTARWYDSAAERGDLDVMTYIHDIRSIPLDEPVCTAAASAGQIRSLEWLRVKGCPLNKCQCVYGAARYGHVPMLEWLQAQPSPYKLDFSVFMVAAMNGDENVTTTLPWLKEKGCDWNELVCHVAAKFGQLRALEWLRSHDPPCPWNAFTFAAVAGRNGCVVLMDWLLAQGCPWDEMACASAARNGNLIALQWLRLNQCPWDENECATEAENNCHTETLGWIRTQSQL